MDPSLDDGGTEVTLSGYRQDKRTVPVTTADEPSSFLCVCMHMCMHVCVCVARDQSQSLAFIRLTGSLPLSCTPSLCSRHSFCNKYLYAYSAADQLGTGISTHKRFSSLGDIS